MSGGSVALVLVMLDELEGHLAAGEDDLTATARTMATIAEWNPRAACLAALLLTLLHSTAESTCGRIGAMLPAARRMFEQVQP